MTGTPKNASCPKCGGSSGFSFTLTETHSMHGGWGDGAESDGRLVDKRVKYSLATCDDCGSSLRVRSLIERGLML